MIHEKYIHSPVERRMTFMSSARLFSQSYLMRSRSRVILCFCMNHIRNRTSDSYDIFGINRPHGLIHDLIKVVWRSTGAHFLSIRI